MITNNIDLENESPHIIHAAYDVPLTGLGKVNIGQWNTDCVNPSFHIFTEDDLDIEISMESPRYLSMQKALNGIQKKELNEFLKTKSTIETNLTVWETLCKDWNYEDDDFEGLNLEQPDYNYL